MIRIITILIIIVVVMPLYRGDFEAPKISFLIGAPETIETVSRQILLGFFLNNFWHHNYKLRLIFRR